MLQIKKKVEWYITCLSLGKKKWELSFFRDKTTLDINYLAPFVFLFFLEALIFNLDWNFLQL